MSKKEADAKQPGLASRTEKSLVAGQKPEQGPPAEPPPGQRRKIAHQKHRRCFLKTCFPLHLHKGPPSSLLASAQTLHASPPHHNQPQASHSPVLSGSLPLGIHTFQAWRCKRRSGPSPKAQQAQSFCTDKTVPPPPPLISNATLETEGPPGTDCNKRELAERFAFGSKQRQESESGGALETHAGAVAGFTLHLRVRCCEHVHLKAP